MSNLLQTAKRQTGSSDFRQYKHEKSSNRTSQRIFIKKSIPTKWIHSQPSFSAARDHSSRLSAQHFLPPTEGKRCLALLTGPKAARTPQN